MCAGVFEEVVVEKAEGEEGGAEQEAPAEDGEEAAPPPPPTYKIYPTPPMTLKIVAPAAAPAEGEEAQEPAEEAQQEQAGEEAAEAGESEGGGGSKDREYDFGRKYPPPFILDGLKLSRGMLNIAGLTIPEDVEAGEYRLKISSTYQSPFCDVEPLYINFTVG